MKRKWTKSSQSARALNMQVTRFLEENAKGSGLLPFQATGINGVIAHIVGDDIEMQKKVRFRRVEEETASTHLDSQKKARRQSKPEK